MPVAVPVECMECNFVASQTTNFVCVCYANNWTENGDLIGAKNSSWYLLSSLYLAVRVSYLNRSLEIEHPQLHAKCS